MLFSNNSLTTFTGYVAEAVYFGGAMSAGSIAALHASHQTYYGTP